MTFDIIIYWGTIATASDTFCWDIGSAAGRMTRRPASLSCRAASTA